MTDTESYILRIPYDIRLLIYEHLFPEGKQIYLQPSPKRLRSITADRSIPIEFLSSCRQLHIEACEYLYNSYLFNIVGRKQDILAAHEGFLEVLRKYARDEVHVQALSNGDHSTTGCISIHVGSGRLETLKRRNRGIPREVHELEEEVDKENKHFQGQTPRNQWVPWQLLWRPSPRSVMLGCALLVAVLALLFRDVRLSTTAGKSSRLEAI